MSVITQAAKELRLHPSARASLLFTHRHSKQDNEASHGVHQSQHDVIDLQRVSVIEPGSMLARRLYGHNTDPSASATV